MAPGARAPTHWSAGQLSTDMTDYPRALRPTSTHSFHTADGRTVAVAKATPTFVRWHGAPPGDDYGGKEILDVDGRPAFAELAILREFERDGWAGVWVDTYRNKFRRAYWGGEPAVQLPPMPREVLDRIVDARGGRRRGTWDVMCWRKSRVVFAESKRKNRDRIRQDQVGFLAAALEVGLSASSFLIVEWDVADPHPAKP
jgi:hypothetical protein